MTSKACALLNAIVLLHICLFGCDGQFVGTLCGGQGWGWEAALVGGLHPEMHASSPSTPPPPNYASKQ